MEEKDIWEGLGVTPDEETPEPQEPETPTEDETDIPGGEEGGEEETPEEEDAEEDGEDGGEGGGPDPDEAHKQELERVRQEGRDALDAQVKGMGLVDPYHGNRPITTQAELEEYQAADREAKIDRYCKAAGMTREQFDELVGNLPEVRAAKDAQERARAAEQTAQEQQARDRLNAEVAEIRKLCPEIKDLEALAAHESYDKVIARMKATGDGVLDAFKHVNFDLLMKQQARDAKRQSARNSRGKDHLRGTGGKGKGGATIPEDQLRIYQRLNPGASLEELQSFHAQNNRR